MEPERYRPGKTCYTPILLGYSRGRSVVRFVAMSLVERLARGCPGTAGVPDLAAMADSSPDRGYCFALGCGLPLTWGGRPCRCRRWTILEVSPSPVYGARLLSGFGAQPHRGFKSRHLRPMVWRDACRARF